MDKSQRRTLGDLRRQAGLTQSGLGAVLGMTQVQISRLEQGRVAKPRRSTREGYVRALQISGNEFDRALAATRRDVDGRLAEFVRNLRRAASATERMELPGLIDEFAVELVRTAFSERPRDWPGLSEVIGSGARPYAASAQQDDDAAYAYAALRALEQLSFSAKLLRTVRLDSDPGAAKKWESWLLDIFRYAGDGDVPGVESSLAIAFSSLLPVAKSDRSGLGHLRDQIDGQRVRHTQGWSTRTRTALPLEFRAIACADVASAVIDAVDSVAERVSPIAPKTPAHAPDPTRPLVPA